MTRHDRGVPSEPRTGRGSSSAERVAAAIREAILSGIAAPGAHITQELWAERLQVPRSSVRDALQSLTAEGLLVHDRNRGYFVTQMDVDEMSQLYLMRRLLEPELLRSIGCLDVAELAALQAAADRVEQAMDSMQTQEVVLLERQFYAALYALSPLRAVAREVERLWALSEVYRASFFFGALESTEFRGYVAERHRKILDMLRGDDREALVALILEGRAVMEQRLSSFLNNRATFFESWTANGRPRSGG